MRKSGQKDKKKELKAQARDKKCAFCVQKKDPVWQDYEKLTESLSSRGRILSKLYSGNCAKHQRVLAKVIKQARHLGLLPFTTQG